MQYSYLLYNSLVVFNVWPSSGGDWCHHIMTPQVIDWSAVPAGGLTCPGPVWLTRTNRNIKQEKSLHQQTTLDLRIGFPVSLEMFTQIESSSRRWPLLQPREQSQSQFSLKYSEMTRMKTLFAKKWGECWQERTGVTKCVEVHGQDDDNNGHLCHRENTNLLSVLSFPLVGWIGLWLILSWIELDLAAMSSHCKTWNSN